MALTKPGTDMLSGLGTAAAATVGTGNSELPTNDDLPAPIFATEEEAEAGSADDVHMSPLRAAQAVAALGLGLRRGGMLDLSSGTGGTVTDIGDLTDVDLIVLQFAGVSVTGSNHLMIRLGDSGGLKSSGYESGSGNGPGSGQFTANSTGLIVYQGGSALWNGAMHLVRMSGNNWSASHHLQVSAIGGVTVGGGQVTLSGALDRVAIAASGADNFDGGSMQLFAGRVG
ncbi:MAG: hypothetical protein P1U37_18785 [Minwuia sp.]|nr:hypothetical protein [Minwuia sp.]